MRRLSLTVALVALALAAAGAARGAADTRLYLPLLARAAPLVFVSDRDSGLTVIEVAADGSGRRTLSGPTTNDSQPFPSPDGRQVAFFSTRDGRNALYVMARDGSGQRRLADCNVCESVRWLPDGRRLLLASLEWLVVDVGPPAQYSALTLLDSAGAPPLPQPRGGVASPDGLRVAYFSSDGGASTLWAAPVAGGAPVAAAAGLPLQGASDLTWSPDGGRLAFRAIYPSESDGVWQAVYIAGLDGREPVRISGASSPIWSPDGAALLVQGPRQPGATGPDSLLVVGRDGGEPRLVGRGASPAWSPDGAWVAYLGVDERNIPDVLTVAAAAGGPPRAIAQGVYRLLGWTPDSARLLYHASDVAPLLVGRGGGEPTRIAGLGAVDSIVWSPGGTTAAAVSPDSSGDGASVFTFRGDGGQLREIPGANTPRWAPDGRLLVTGRVRTPPRIYSRVEGAPEPLALAEGGLLALSPRGDLVAYVRGGRLFVSPLERVGERALAPDLAVTARPAWSPDGERLAVAAELGGEAGLYVVGAADGAARRVAGCGQGCTSLAWSPDGATLLFWAEGIYTVAAAGGPPRLLAEGQHPAWSPDGARVAYVAGDIFVIGADGTGARLVAACGGEPPFTSGCSGLGWAPTGDRLAYELLVSAGRYVAQRVVTVTTDGARVELLPGRDPQWGRGPGAVALRYDERFGHTMYAPYELSSLYIKLCLGRPCRPYPPGHGNVLEYGLAP